MVPSSVPTSERWRENWRAVSPPGGVLVRLDRSRANRQASYGLVAALPAGTPVILAASAPRALRRCRTFAAAAGIRLEREYLALPSAEAPAYLVEDVPAAVDVFLESILLAPPGVPFRAAVELGVRIVRSLRSRRLARAAARGRLAVGWCM